MPQENVEIVRRMIEAVNRRDLDAAFRDVAPGATFDFSRSRGLDAGVYVGHDAIRRFWTEMTEPFEHAMVPDRFAAHGEHVVVSIVSHIAARGVDVQARTAAVATLSDGRIVRLTMYQERREALEAVGLEK